jgi:hypothetical protein
LVTELALRNNIRAVDLFETLSETPGGERLFFRAGDNHWNNAGQRRAAVRVAEELGRDQPPKDL